MTTRTRRGNEMIDKKSGGKLSVYFKEFGKEKSVVACLMALICICFFFCTRLELKFLRPNGQYHAEQCMNRTKTFPGRTVQRKLPRGRTSRNLDT